MKFGFLALALAISSALLGQISPTTLTFQGVSAYAQDYPRAITLTGGSGTITVSGCANTITTGGSLCAIMHTQVTSTLTAGTYTSGITAVGSVSQTCVLNLFNGGGELGAATVALTGTNTIAGGTALVITNGGGGYTSSPTTAIASPGTAASCSGTATVSTTTAPNQVYVYWTGSNLTGFPACSTVGTNCPQSTITITQSGSCPSGCTETINYQTFAPSVQNWKTPNGAAVNCAVGSAIYQHEELCTITNAVPGGTRFLPTTPGTSTTDTDPNFGPGAGSVRYRVTPSNAIRVILTDGPQSSVSTTGNYVITETLPGGTTYITKTNGTGDVLTVTTLTDGDMLWDPSYTAFNPGLDAYLYTTHSATIHRVLIPGGSDADIGLLVGTTGPSFTALYSLASSNDTMVVGGKYFPLTNNVHVTGNSPIALIADVTNGTYVTYNYGSLTTISPGNPNPSSSSQTNIRGILQCSQGFSGVSGKMWCILEATSATSAADELLSWLGPGHTIVDEGPMPVRPSSSDKGFLFKQISNAATDCANANCNSAGHAGWVEVSIGGVKHELFVQGVDLAAYSVVTASDPDAGGAVSMFTPVQAGGGAYFLFPIDHQLQDFHVGGALTAPLSIITVDNGNSAPAVYGYAIRSLTTGTPGSLTVDANYINGNLPVSNGNKIVGSPITLSGVTGLLDVNNKCTIAGLTNLTGSVNVTGGTALTATSGPAFDSALAGHYIQIAGVTTCSLGSGKFCKVATVNSGTSLTLTDNAGTVSGATAQWGSTFNCGGTLGGTWTAGTGIFTPDVTMATSGVNGPYQNQSDMMILDFSPMATGTSATPINVVELLKTRGVSVIGDYTGTDYYVSQTSISPDGTLQCGHSDSGAPDNLAVYCGATGFSLPTPTGNTTFSGATISGVTVR